MLNHWARVAVSIVCDQVRVPEHGIKAVDDKRAECYIASEAGKLFAIEYGNRLPCGLLVNIYLDGGLAGSFYSAPGTDCVVTGARIRPSLERPFMFSSLSTTESDAVGDVEHGRLDHLGLIQVDVYRFAAEWESQTFCPSRWDNVGPVREIAKKCGTHQIRLGDAVISKPRPQVEGHLLDPMGHPYAQFIFHYRPHEVLEASDIISPLAASRTRRVGTSTPDSSSMLHMKTETSILSTSSIDAREGKLHTGVESSDDRSQVHLLKVRLNGAADHMEVTKVRAGDSPTYDLPGFQRSSVGTRMKINYLTADT